ncbi:LysR family transcriptional regulator [Tunturiibacter lichenicola]|jgi:LysR family transcriptional regulator, cell division regulator|uniref:LysR family transcriptional regulator n=1 Tax=Tunturiibacter lichenicola TaxID=2051959 RepID=UPI003D9ACBD9
MDIDDLRIVDAVARSGSMSRAAAALNMVQSNVTARIRLLEDELGVQLFTRHSRGVQASDAGLRLLSYSQQIGALFREAVEAVKEDGVPKGTLRIGTTVNSVRPKLPMLAVTYAKGYPRVELSIINGTTTSLIDQVLENRIDGAFVSGPVLHHELDVQPIGFERLVLISPVSMKSLDELSQVENLRAIVFAKDCSYRQMLEAVLDGMGLRYQTLEFDSLDALVTCITAGVGVTILPDALVDGPWKDHVAVHTLPPDRAQVEIVFVRRLDRHPSSTLNAFLKMVR